MNALGDRVVVDTAIVGCGPVGLTAALYFGRFLHSVAVFDAGDARAELIPRTNNCPGFPEGISGIELLSRLRCQTAAHGVKVIESCISRVKKRTAGSGLRHQTVK